MSSRFVWRHRLNKMLESELVSESKKPFIEKVLLAMNNNENLPSDNQRRLLLVWWKRYQSKLVSPVVLEAQEATMD